MTVIVKHNKTNSITDWTQAQLDEQIALGNFPSGTTLANIVLPSDWNNDHTLTGLGTMAEQDATAVAITGGTINNTTIGATTATTGKFTSVTTPSVTATTTDLTLSAISTGAVKFNTLGGLQAQVTDVASSDSYVNLSGGVGVATVAAGSSAGSVDLRLDSRASGNVRLRTAGGTEQLRASHTASAVNYVQVTGATTGNRPTITAQGSDGNAGLSLFAKGTGGVFIGSNLGTTAAIVSTPTTGTNYFAVNGSATTIAPTIAVAGGDTNIPLALQTKGTGAIDLAAGSSGVNISNGGTVTAVTITNNGANYTSFPSIAISAPTTAGGVQATISLLRMFQNGATVANGGTGYAVGNVLTVVGGTNPGTAATLTVTTVSGGVITGVSSTNFAQYTALPTNPVSVTGGAGSGATLNLTWSVPNSVLGTSYSITNAGSGYIEQPTITFSGGGGSGAAAYATVGSGTIVRSLGSTMLLQTTGGIAFGVTDIANSVNYIRNQGSTTGNQVFSTVQGTDTNVAYGLTSKGTGGINFFTNLGNQLQLAVSHTASAVNYVQVTGSATGAQPTISSQGSDTNIPLQFNTKGNQAFNFYTNGGTQRQFRIVHTSSSVNFGYTAGSATGTAVTFGVDALSSDTDIDLTLTPKGTGVVQFGTYTGTILTPTGFITIKDSGGTTRRLLVG
jgi:hypothetical protein